MTLSALEEEVLESCCNDYEAPRTIARGVSARAEQTASEATVLSVLLSLADRGFVQAYRYDKPNAQWVAISPEVAVREPDPWFATTALGRSQVEDEDR
jgi:predicted transcriptional regulator